MKRGALLGALVVAGAACSEQSPTSADPDLKPIEPTSVEVRLTWEEFGSNLEVFGGYGSPRELGSGIVAHAFGGVLEGRTLVDFADLPATATVTDTTGTSRADTLLTLTGGRVVAFVDTVSAVAEGPVTLELGALRQSWDPNSLTWVLAVDSGSVEVPWDEPGAGPLDVVTTAVWDPATSGDSVVFALDSAQVEIWRDTAQVDQGAVLAMATAGARLRVTNVVLRASVIPSVRPDTTVFISASPRRFSFVYTPEPEGPAGSVRVGGAPAWRTVLDVVVPARLNGPPSLCAAAGCPVELTPTRVNYAALVLTSAETQAAFQPSDSLGLDVRAVYHRAAMPKSPLGPSLIPRLGGQRVGPSLFTSEAGSEVEIPITEFIRAILENDTTATFPPPRSFALLSPFEPSSLTFASFFGPGTPGAPVLKLIVTAGRSVELP